MFNDLREKRAFLFFMAFTFFKGNIYFHSLAYFLFISLQEIEKFTIESMELTHEYHIFNSKFKKEMDKKCTKECHQIHLNVKL
jgi:hypothetical protein